MKARDVVRAVLGAHGLQATEPRPGCFVVDGTGASAAWRLRVEVNAAAAVVVVSEWPDDVELPAELPPGLETDAATGRPVLRSTVDAPGGRLDEAALTRALAANLAAMDDVLD